MFGIVCLQTSSGDYCPRTKPHHDGPGKITRKAKLHILCGPASHYQTRLARLEIIQQAETIPKCLTKTFVISAVHINLHEVTFEECSTCCQLILKKKKTEKCIPSINLAECKLAIRFFRHGENAGHFH